MKQVIIRYLTLPDMEKYIISDVEDCRVRGNILILMLSDGRIVGINTDRISDFIVEDSNE